MRIKPIFAWYDLWVGAFYDRAKRRLYIFPVPCIGFYVERTPRTALGSADKAAPSHEAKEIETLRSQLRATQEALEIMIKRSREATAELVDDRKSRAPKPSNCRTLPPPEMGPNPHNAWYTACVNILWTSGETYKLFHRVKDLAEAIERGEAYPAFQSEERAE
jgi:hypothetical protein